MSDTQEAESTLTAKRWRGHAYFWAVRFLTPEENDHLGELADNLYDSIYLVNSEHRNDAKNSLDDGLRNWRAHAHITEDRVVAYFSALFRLFVFGFICRCPAPSTHQAETCTIEKRREVIWPRLEETIINFQNLNDPHFLQPSQVTDDIIAICEDPVVAPHFVAGGKFAPQFANFQKFCLLLYRKGILQHLAPAEFAVNEFFVKGIKADVTFYWVCQWFIYASRDIFESVDNAKDNWMLWHMDIIQQALVYKAEFNIDGDALGGLQKLILCGKIAGTEMRKVSGALSAQVQLLVDGLHELRDDVHGGGRA
ncbi:hypothetical protein BKA67DRAFT_539070 [Truncatella angustata]|uniref:Uncharacterized protein n=1 Tax=Truncatella angustata TaxID=152316 RepID=A0A9P8ZVN6_9PEZI|nr:uncharacterized protein BKA67DRAFT_539070 [Truncatella angustata]KAH6649073.1 hypothetical protein BKA67DRAFT_539070 [Truncatella angustata]